MLRNFGKLSVAFGFLIGLAVPLAAQEKNSSDEELFQKVMGRLLKNEAFIKDYPPKFDFPPKAFIKPKSVKELNAYASAAPVHGAEVNAKTGKTRPIVTITEGLLKQVVAGDENVLAIVMGHELAHLTKEHVVTLPKGETTLLLMTFGRGQELEADLNGMRYALSSGYSFRNGVGKAFSAMRKTAKYSSFEGLNASHPTWEERLVFLDRAQATLWSAMTAFQNGNVFLQLEQYASAVQCFKAVTAEFPDCYEGWANLGYARLMLYCDGLDADDLKRIGIGQIVTGGFYSRPESLETKVRGMDEKLWKDAVTALNRSLSLKPDLVLPRASLGVAYLVHPEGKDLKKARKWFQEALDHVNRDPEVKRNAISAAALSINAGVADLAAGDTKEADAKFAAADKMLDFASSSRGISGMFAAVDYNRALVKARSKDDSQKRQARKMFESYLRGEPAESAWWSLAYQQYVKLGKDLGEENRPFTSFFRKAAPGSLRAITSVSVGDEAIALAEPATLVVKRFGEKNGERFPLYPDSKIVRWRFPGRGIDVLAKEKVLAIFLTNDKAPPVPLRQAGIGGKKKELKIGMSKDSAKLLLKDQPADTMLRFIADTRHAYHFYPELGVGIRYGHDRVEEIVVAQLPRAMFGVK